MHEVLKLCKSLYSLFISVQHLKYLTFEIHICRCAPRLLRPFPPPDQDPRDEHPGEAAGAREQGGGGAQQAGPPPETALQDIRGWERGAVGRTIW